MITQTSQSKKAPLTTAGKAKQISYWLITGLVLFELVYGALWDFNWINKGYVYDVLRHLGYPLYLAAVLGMGKLVAAGIIVVPGVLRLKEWAYAGLSILFLGGFVSHSLVGDGLAQSVWSLLFGLLVIGSWLLRPANRRFTFIG